MQADSLMPANLRPLRSMLHATVVEVLLYLTPLHCQDMLDSVVLSLNSVHAKFMRLNPDFTARAPDSGPVHMGEISTLG